jgi:hypothetical protein
MRRLAVLISVLVAANAASGAPNSNVYKAQLKAYIDCNLRSARSIAKQPGDPVSLAFAAQGMCVREEAALREAIRPTFNDPANADATMSSLAGKTLRANAATIVRVRGSD